MTVIVLEILLFSPIYDSDHFPKYPSINVLDGSIKLETTVHGTVEENLFFVTGRRKLIHVYSGCEVAHV